MVDDVLSVDRHRVIIPGSKAKFRIEIERGRPRPINPSTRKWFSLLRAFGVRVHGFNCKRFKLTPHREDKAIWGEPHLLVKGVFLFTTSHRLGSNASDARREIAILQKRVKQLLRRGIPAALLDEDLFCKATTVPAHLREAISMPGLSQLLDKARKLARRMSMSFSREQRSLKQARSRQKKRDRQDLSRSERKAGKRDRGSVHPMPRRVPATSRLAA